MFEPESKLRHLPFFEEIASREEGSDDWHAASAGLVVLRLADSWLEDAFVADDDWAVRSVRCTIEAMNHGTPIRAILDRVVDAIQQQKPDIHAVVSPLLAYGRSLEYDAKWLLATDVYHSILAHLHPIEDSDASIAAHMRLGYCYRSLHQIDEASEAFTAASEIATEAGDMVNVVLARVNEGHIAALRGNLPQAEAILDDAIMRSFAPEFRDVRSRALHERSNVAHRRKDYEFAVQLAYSAFRQSQNPIERDRILNDLASGFWELGVFSAARDAYLVLSATGQEQYTRWTATINLMDVSTEIGGQPLFELYRRQLLDVPLPPFLATAFELTSGLAYRRFRDFDKSRSLLKRALAMAEEHRLNQFVFEAEEALRELEAAPPPRVSAEASLDLQEVAMAIRELRETVSAS